MKSTLNIHWKDWCKAEYFDHLMWRTDSLEKTLMLGKTEGRRRRCKRGWDGWMASWTQWTWVWANSRREWRIGRPGMLQSMGLQNRSWLSDWTINHKFNLNFVVSQPNWLCNFDFHLSTFLRGIHYWVLIMNIEVLLAELGKKVSEMEVKYLCKGSFLFLDYEIVSWT